ncbi:hypothetical protein GCM10019016_098460 [Streptomyces prasinosporus]|uniref:Uncharacterized protein n=1 Tax=Streptomyces prasinosporus TaxID=68256 RepID=A0ABP6U7Q4_9ACTN
MGDARTEEREGQTEQSGGCAARQMIHTGEARQRAPPGASAHGLNDVGPRVYADLRPWTDTGAPAPLRARPERRESHEAATSFAPG